MLVDRQQQHQAAIPPRRTVPQGSTQGGNGVLGQGAVDQRGVGGFTVPFRLGQGVMGLVSGGEVPDRGAQGRQAAADYLAGGSVFFAQQDIPARQGIRRQGRLGRRRIEGQVNHKPKRTALVQGAFHADLPLHALHDASRDRQAQAGPAITAGGT